MKKFLIALVAGSGLLCSQANAQIPTPPTIQTGGENDAPVSSRNVQGMLGIEANGIFLAVDNDIKVYDFIKDTLYAFTTSAGVKFPKVYQSFGIGISAFYQKSSKEDKKSVSGKYDTTIGYDAYGVDLSLYIPVSKNVDITGNIGFGSYDFKVKMTNTDTSGVNHYANHEKHNGLRLGAGVEFKMIENLAFTGSVRYVDFDYDDTYDNIKGLTEFGVGLKMYF